MDTPLLLPAATMTADELARLLAAPAPRFLIELDVPMENRALLAADQLHHFERGLLLWNKTGHPQAVEGVHHDQVGGGVRQVRQPGPSIDVPDGDSQVPGDRQHPPDLREQVRVRFEDQLRGSRTDGGQPSWQGQSATADESAD